MDKNNQEKVPTNNNDQFIEAKNDKVIETKDKVKKKKIKKNRCFVCNKKISILPFKCKCHSKKVFCSLHRMPESHNCTFDFHQDAKNKLELNNPKIEFGKFDKIE